MFVAVEDFWHLTCIEKFVAATLLTEDVKGINQLKPDYFFILVFLFRQTLRKAVPSASEWGLRYMWGYRGTWSQSVWLYVLRSFMCGPRNDILCYSYHTCSYNQYIDQQVHWTNCSSCQVSNSFIFIYSWCTKNLILRFQPTWPTSIVSHMLHFRL